MARRPSGIQFTVWVKEELAALRPAAPAERRALLAALLRFAATLHTGYEVRPDLRVRGRGALAPRARYEVVLDERVERVLGHVGILDGQGRLAFGVPGALV